MKFSFPLVNIEFILIKSTQFSLNNHRHHLLSVDNRVSRSSKFGFVCSHVCETLLFWIGSYHASDLKQLSPSDEELLEAIGWAKTHDPSEGFHSAIKLFLREFGYERLVDKI